MLEPSTDILMVFIVASSPKQSLSWRHEANMMNEFLMRFGRVTLATWKGKGKKNHDDQTSPHNYLRQS